MPLDRTLLLPAQDGVRGQLGAIVRDDHQWLAQALDDPIEFAHDPPCGSLLISKLPLMAHLTPLAELIRNRMQELGLTDEVLGRRLGYSNSAKAAGRVHALTNGLPLSVKSRLAIRRLPDALEVALDAVLQAEAATDQLFADQERQAEEHRRAVEEAGVVWWRHSFQPHGVIYTERTVPSQITCCAMTGGTRCRLVVPFDLSQPPITYIKQGVDALPKMIRTGDDGAPYVTFFGRALGLIVNYTPDRALRCDLEGNPLEVLKGAYRIGEVVLSFGRRPVSPTVISRVLGR